MRTRTLVLLLLAPLAPLSVLGTSFGIGGCNPAITLDSPIKTDAAPDPGPGDPLDASTEPDAYVDPIEPQSDASIDAPLDVAPTWNMAIDGVSCHDVGAVVTTQTAPDGKSWTLDLHGTCGAYGLVDAFVASKDDIAYPQACGASTRVQVSVASEGDASVLAYSTSAAGGACAIGSGPSFTDQDLGIKLNATIANASGATHSLSYTAANAP